MGLDPKASLLGIYDPEARAARGDHQTTALIIWIVQALKIIDFDADVRMHALQRKDVKFIHGNKAFEIPPSSHEASIQRKIPKASFRIVLIPSAEGEQQGSFVIESDSEKLKLEALLNFIKNELPILKNIHPLVLKTLYDILLQHPDDRVQNAIKAFSDEVSIPKTPSNDFLVAL